MKAIRSLEYCGPLVVDDIPTPTIARDKEINLNASF